MKFNKYLSSLKEESERRGLDIGCSPSHQFTNHILWKSSEDDACPSGLESGLLKKHGYLLRSTKFVAETNNYVGDVPSKAKNLALKRKPEVNQSRQPTKCFRSEILILRIRCSLLEDTEAELRKRIELLEEKCFVVPAEIDRNVAEDTDDRGLTIHSSEKSEDSSCNMEALPEKHYPKMEQVQVTTEQSNCDDELNVCQHNGKVSPSSSAGCSKRRGNGGVNRVSRSAKKKKEFGSVATMIQTSHSVAKKVQGVLMQDSPPYCCNICDKTFSDKRYWRRHQQEYSMPFQCPKCKKQLAGKYHLIKHQTTHGENRPYKCGFCDARFKHNNDRLRHERYMHTEVACFECAVCGKMFNHRGSIINHLQIHSGQKPFRCQTCGTRFSCKQYLVSHQKVHSKEKNFKCRICNKKFKHRQSSAKHERLHVEGARFECALCGKKYHQKQNLVHHISHNCC